jgi:HPt (histidine-containing phosphotransfer) domain-containing protein
MNRWVRLHKPGFWQQAQEQFEESYRRQTQTIAAACSKGRFREAGEAAHSLKGVCLMLGLRHLGDICHSLEALGPAGDGEGWQRLLDELEASREPSLQAWRTWTGE